MGQRDVTHPVFGRAITVLAPDGRLAVALRERVDRAYATVLEDMAGDADDVEALRPAPWMLVGEGAAPRADLDARLRATPALVAWLGQPPARLPAGAVVVTRFAELVAEVNRRLSSKVAGMRLSPGDGVTMPDGAQHRSRLLEALVSAHPDPVFGGAAGRGSVDLALADHDVAMRTAAATGGGTVLEPVPVAVPPFEFQ